MKKCGAGVGFTYLLNISFPMGASLIMSVFFSDDPNLYSNLSNKMPVSIQIVGRRNEDEKVIAVAKFLEDNHITCSG